jgi:membrane associated rhomboid family serine protease
LDPAADIPVWARKEAFPSAPLGYGWQDRRKSCHACSDLAELVRAVAEDRASRVDLVWTPDSDHLVVPEEVPALLDALGRVRRHWARDDAADGLRRIRWFGGLALVAAGWAWLHGGVLAVRHSGTLGVVLMVGLIFGFIPWYQARKRLRAIAGWNADLMASRVPEMRFETWLGRQRAPVTYGLIGLMLLVGAAQLIFQSTVWRQAALEESLYAAGEWWRLLTAPWLHGHPIHWVLNAGALIYLGRRVEVMARWPHLLMVFFMAVIFGGMATLHGGRPSIGASGGIMGLLGFLLVFETLHAGLVPVSARRRLLGGLALTAVIGALAYEYIDNWAHAGGLVGGLAYAAIVFPRSASPHRPASTQTDVVVGACCGLILLGSAALAFLKLVPG